jgi:hypothetical protein
MVACFVCVGGASFDVHRLAPLLGGRASGEPQCRDGTSQCGAIGRPARPYPPTPRALAAGRVGPGSDSLPRPLRVPFAMLGRWCLRFELVPDNTAVPTHAVGAACNLTTDAEIDRFVCHRMHPGDFVVGIATAGNGPERVDLLDCKVGEPEGATGVHPQGLSRARCGDLWPASDSRNATRTGRQAGRSGDVKTSCLCIGTRTSGLPSERFHAHTRQ